MFFDERSGKAERLYYSNLQSPSPAIPPPQCLHFPVSPSHFFSTEPLWKIKNERLKMKKPPQPLSVPLFPTPKPPFPSPPFTSFLRRQRFCRCAPSSLRSSPTAPPLLPTVPLLFPTAAPSEKLLTTFRKLLTTFSQPLSTFQKLLTTFQKPLSTFLKLLTTFPQRWLRCPQRGHRYLPKQPVLYATTASLPPTESLLSPGRLSLPIREGWGGSFFRVKGEGFFSFSFFHFVGSVLTAPTPSHPPIDPFSSLISWFEVKG